MILFALFFLIFGHTCAGFGPFGAAFYVLVLIAFWLAVLFDIADFGVSYFVPRFAVGVAVAQFAGFVLFLFGLIGQVPR